MKSRAAVVDVDVEAASATAAAWKRSASGASAALRKGSGKSLASPTRLLVTSKSGLLFTRFNATRYAAWPLSEAARRATGLPTSLLRRRPSAVTVPCAAKRMAPSGCSPPSMVTSPPSSLPAPPTMENPCCEKSMRPRAPLSIGMSGRSLTSLPVNATLPRTAVAGGSASGTVSVSFSSALPVAVLWASALPIQPPTGDALTKRNRSPEAPRPAPSSISTGRSSSRLMPPCTPVSVTPCVRAWALRICIDSRSNTSSPLSASNAGHGEM